MSTIAKALLDNEAVFLRPDNFFTWTSGIKSPIYCDNRILISIPQARKMITQLFCQEVKKKYPNVELIAGTATAGIPWASWIAEDLNLPMVYIRGKSKDHGRGNLIEGRFQENQMTVIIEDLISTGKSSLAAVEAIEKEKMNCLGVISIFSYNLSLAKEKFLQNKVPYSSLATLDDLLSYSLSEGSLTKEQVDKVFQWKEGMK